MRQIGSSILLGALNVCVAAALLTASPRLMLMGIALRLFVGIPIEAFMWRWSIEATTGDVPLSRFAGLTLLVMWLHLVGACAAAISSAPSLLLGFVALRAGQFALFAVLMTLTACLAMATSAAVQGLFLAAPALYARGDWGVWRCASHAVRIPGRMRRVRLSLLAVGGRILGAVAGLIGAVLATPWLMAAIALDPDLAHAETRS